MGFQVQSWRPVLCQTGQASLRTARSPGMTWRGLLVAGALIGLLLYALDARGQGYELTRAVVIRVLAEKGWVAGNVIELDRPYYLERLTVKAIGDGEFIVTFKARGMP